LTISAARGIRHYRARKLVRAPAMTCNAMYYFAYGSNLSSNFIRDYTPSAEFVMKAELPNYKVEFRHYSENLGGGISSIVEMPGNLVKGVIYEVPESELEALDILESVPEGLYRRDTFMVMGEDGRWHRADLYRVSTPTGPYAPSTSYVDYMIEGAREHGLDADYVEQLVAIRNSLD
jgi:gamma-glutamylcyclotransferase (GGCT)/AIG2-like uncharacterized protein YtfP